MLFSTIEIRLLSGKLVHTLSDSPYIPRLQEHVVIGQEYFQVREVAYDILNADKAVLYVENHTAQFQAQQRYAHAEDIRFNGGV